MKEKKPNKTIKKIILLSIVLIIIVAIVLGIIFILNFGKIKEEKMYEEKMNTYGFSKLYNNQTANSSENVTKSEMLKMVIAALLNTDDIADIANSSSDTYNNAIWVNYAKDMNVIEDSFITSENEASNVSYIDTIKIVSKAKKVLLTEEYGKIKDVEIKDMEEYSDSEQKAIRDLLANGLLDNKKEKLKANKDITKGQFNKLIIKAFEKYNVTYGTIEEDENNLPTNKDDYPYILKEIPKEIYEIAFINNDEEKFKTPNQTYGNLKNKYIAIKQNVENYYNFLLNVNYETITEEEMLDKTKSLTVGLLEENEIKDYIEYVRNNKIKLEGKATVLLPIIYYDGIEYRVRTHLEFEIKNSNTDKNLLFLDISDTKYTGNKIDCYIDVRLGKVFDNDNFYSSLKPISTMLLNNKDYGIRLVESEGE